MNNKELKIKLMAIQGTLAILDNAGVVPKCLNQVTALRLMSKTADVFEEHVEDNSEVEAIEELLKGLLEEIGVI